jgi:hypothetical protein
VEIEIPDGKYACVGPNTTTLKAKITPQAPPGGTIQWSKGVCAANCGDGTFTPANAVSSAFKGTVAGSVTGKVEVTNSNGTTKAEQDLAAVTIQFSKAPTEDAAGNKFGYDDFDTATSSNDDHVSVGKNDKTNVYVVVTGTTDDVKDAVSFTSVNTSVADLGPLPTPAPASGFLLEIDGGDTDKAGTVIQARAGSSSGPLCAKIQVNTYKEKEFTELKVYRVTDSTSAGTAPLTALDADTLKDFDNSVVKKGVLKFDKVTVEDKNIHYDLDGNGGLNYYWDDANDQPELKVIQNQNLAGNPKVVLVKNVNFSWRLSAAAPAGQDKLTMRGVSYIDDWKDVSFTLDKGAAKETVTVVDVTGNVLTLSANLQHAHAAGVTLWQKGGGASTDPAICYDSPYNDACFLHETLHRPNVGSLLDVFNPVNIMHFQLGPNHTELRFKDQPKNYGGGNENQWETIPR